MSDAQAILVTGARGFLGGHLSEHLAAAGRPVVGVSRATGCDVTDPAAIRAVVRSVRPMAIVHLAGPAFVPDSRRDPEGFWKAHVVGTLNLLEAVREAMNSGAVAGPPRILLAGTADSYRPDPARLPFDEETPIEPENPYAAAKLAQEALGVGWHRTFGMPIVRARLFNVIGPGQDERFVASNFTKQAAEVSLGRCDGVIDVGDLTVARDFIDWRDAMEALTLLLDRGRPGEVYNLASGVARPIGSILEHHRARRGLTFTTRAPELLARPGQATVRCGSAAKLRNELGWMPRRSFEESLDAIWEDWVLRLTRRTA